MDTISKEQLSQLIDQTDQALLSLYMPTERSGREVQQNRIRFKNLINESQKAVQSAQGDTSTLRKQLEKLSSLEADDDWWQHQSDGLVFLLDGKKVQRWRLPLKFPSICVCSDRYHIRPLIRFLQNDGRFYVLAVSMNDVRLLLGSKSSIIEIEDAELPDDLRTALNIDEYVSSLQLHSTNRGAREAMFHGHGGSDPDVKKQDEINQYFRYIDAALDAYLGLEERPLVFAGVQYLFPLFSEACDYRTLLDTPITGNPDELNSEELHAKAWPLVEKCFDAKRGELIEQFGSALSGGVGSDDLDEVLKAASQGQVASLLVSQDQYAWTSDLEADSAKATEAASGGDRINMAVVETLRNGGEVYTVAEGTLDKPVAAIFRYPSN